MPHLVGQGSGRGSGGRAPDTRRVHTGRSGSGRGGAGCRPRDQLWPRASRLLLVVVVLLVVVLDGGGMLGPAVRGTVGGRGPVHWGCCDRGRAVACRWRALSGRVPGRRNVSPGQRLGSRLGKELLVLLLVPSRTGLAGERKGERSVSEIPAARGGCTWLRVHGPPDSPARCWLIEEGLPPALTSGNTSWATVGGWKMRGAAKRFIGGCSMYPDPTRLGFSIFIVAFGGKSERVQRREPPRMREKDTQDRDESPAH